MIETHLEKSLDRVDVALLSVFCTVVDCGGYSAAQAQLNVSASTISMKMTALEKRLNLRLCQRGRVGFRLTEDGETVFRAAQKLFQAHGDFQGEIANLKGRLAGSLGIAMIDATVTNPDFKLAQTIRTFTSAHPDVHLTILVEEPSQIERQLLSGDIQLGIAPFYHHIPNLNYIRLFDEPHSLYCGRGHYLFDRKADEISRHDVEKQPRVRRGYVPASAPLFKQEQPATATVFDMEAMMHLLLSGSFIGYVPCHFAKNWVEKDSLRPIRPDLYQHVSVIEAAVRKGAENQRITKGFLDEYLVIQEVQA